MRVYFHYEEAEPQHTAVLVADSPDISLAHLLERFLESYSDKYGDEAAPLDPSTLELRNARNKKLKPNAFVHGLLSEKEDVFVSSGGKAKSSRTSSARPAARAPAPQPAAPQPAAPQPQAAAAQPMPAIRPQVAAPPMAPDPAPEMADQGIAELASKIQNMAGAEKFKHQMERDPVSFRGSEEMEVSSPVPTHEHHVQANCIKCRQAIFYKGQTSLFSCHACSFLQIGVECANCGTFFPTEANAAQTICPFCRHTDSLSSFDSKRDASFTGEGDWKEMAEPAEIHLVMQFYIDNSAERQQEVEECLRRNVVNPHIRHIHVLTEEGMDLNRFQKGDKIVQYVQGSWLTYDDAVQYCRRFLQGRICVIANADIHFDESLGKLRFVDMERRCYAITRHDVRAGGLSFSAGAAPISQDAWIFMAPLPSSVQNLDFKMGKPGCDNRMAYELRVGGMLVTNPCYSIIVHHRHMSDKRNYVHGKDTVMGNYAAVIPIKAIV